MDMISMLHLHRDNEFCPQMPATIYWMAMSITSVSRVELLSEFPVSDEWTSRRTRARRMHAAYVIIWCFGTEFAVKNSAGGYEINMLIHRYNRASKAYWVSILQLVRFGWILYTIYMHITNRSVGEWGRTMLWMRVVWIAKDIREWENYWIPSVSWCGI
jgi:hypothetical protein